MGAIFFGINPDEYFLVVNLVEISTLIACHNKNSFFSSLNHISRSRENQYRTFLLRNKTRKNTCLLSNLFF
jgi:hypothetical protein